jgi:hypothetical protein
MISIMSLTRMFQPNHWGALGRKTRVYPGAPHAKSLVRWLDRHSNTSSFKLACMNIKARMNTAGTINTSDMSS